MVMLATVGCDNRSARLGGETNVTMAFYGRVVDQDGAPVAGAAVGYQVEAYPADYSFETRDKPHDFTDVAATSAADGTFTLNVTGEIIRMRSVTKDGYRLLWDEDVSGGTPSVFGYGLVGSGRSFIRFSPATPAVYIMVKDGLNYSRVLPCRGGSEETLHGWVANVAKPPVQPSIKGIRFIVGGATQPAR